MQELKIGMVGLDTSHCEAFASVLNDPASPHRAAGARVAQAFPGGSPAFSKSVSRLEGFTRSMREKFGVKIVDSLQAVGQGMDAFFLNSVDGRQHLEQFRALAQFGKPVFIDKPFACSTADARAIAALSQQKKAPVMTASCIRFADNIAGLCPSGASVRSAEAFGPMDILPDYPGYFWYGIHSAEVLFSYMGQGCQKVQAVFTDGMDLLVGTWKDGRIGTLRGTRFEGSGFGCTVFTTAGIKHGQLSEELPYYLRMIQQVVPFFQTGKSPIPVEQSVDIVRFLEAAWESRQAGGQVVTM